jgi:DNA-binding transcriptional regulator WhiA
VKYINFDINEQVAFMKLVKRKSKLTWNALAHFLNLSRGMIFFYANSKSKIPKENYEKLCQLIKIKPVHKSYIIIKNKTLIIKEVKETNENLAELLGILAGDGHLSNINHEISVTCHRKDDKEYILNHVSRLFRDLFEVNVKIKEQDHNNTIKSVVNSKMLSLFLTSKFKIPKGKKKGSLRIPKQILKRKKLLRSYIRGLFDTDGSFYLRRKTSMVVSIASRDPPYLDEVKQALMFLGYNPSVSGKNLYIYRQEQIKRFFEEIGSSNKKHKNKYDNFINRMSNY